mmetsp:Transcript_17577/g.30784  ORF Transcript_17577/g.30784 Transcript_17577/m.30784 type:complete len:537 (-) Transcript_17577:45-1655(-)|eukprot:CAMPEP_0197654938 /NCGR_PEP_ID=MMETSP1338-20131121/39149_1 /TAXON_ID=43686 ORGANISM="Pelagodinium beii, Strain RCC1491" /NCGR_SAMPLE_ID=MMETSP1338 /ASSEMBLY_ACC=CAM_ASM_000754 /LENGTH=536 /DNA_ID=CAMNT_0043230481 /DNA_START=66 /DNA_END=1676 /DNA_ORIENTATION=-
MGLGPVDEKSGGKKAQGTLAGVVKLVVRTFLEEKHYRQLHRILGEQWSGAHSLSAVVRLMEAHGMKVTPEEEQQLAGLSEDRMIDALVQRMPQQSREQYEHFFLQLSFIASTTTRLRAALETGNPDVVEEALESAENVGVLPYLMRMAVAQAGSEVKTMEEGHDTWLVDTDGRMAPLLQAQATSMATQKTLAQAKAQIGGYHDTAKEKAQGVLMGMIQANEEAVMAVTFTGWSEYVKKLKREEGIRSEYQEQLDNANKKLFDYKQAQMDHVRSVMVAGSKDADMALMGVCFAALIEEALSSKMARETSKEVEELNKTLRGFADAAAEKAKSVMARMNDGNEEAMKAMAFKGWTDYVHLEKNERVVNDAMKASQDKQKEFMATQSAGAKSVLQRMTASNDAGLVSMGFTGWKEVVQEEKKAAELEAAMSAKSAALSDFSGRNKASALSASDRSAQLQDLEMLCYVVCIWKRETRVERMRRYGKQKNDKRKQDLMGVKGLFRSFANDLESSLKAGTPRVEVPKGRHGDRRAVEGAPSP